VDGATALGLGFVQLVHEGAEGAVSSGCDVAARPAGDIAKLAGLLPDGDATGVSLLPRLLADYSIDVTAGARDHPKPCGRERDGHDPATPTAVSLSAWHSCLFLRAARDPVSWLEAAWPRLLCHTGSLAVRPPALIMTPGSHRSQDVPTADRDA
jgi:hypothetical protein